MGACLNALRNREGGSAARWEPRPERPGQAWKPAWRAGRFPARAPGDRTAASAGTARGGLCLAEAEPCGNSEPQLTFTSIAFGASFSLLGMRTVSTPSWNSAFAFSPSAAAGSVKERKNAP
jgi:hypothetical protein